MYEVWSGPTERWKYGHVIERVRSVQGIDMWFKQKYRGLIRGGLLMLIALGVLAGSGVFNQREAEAQGSGLYRAVKSVNIRSKASSDSKILATAPKNAIVATLGPAKGCGAHSCTWIKVAFDGVEGWAI